MREITDETAYLRWVAHRLRYARLRLRMTQAEASERSGLHINTIRNYEGGRSVPSAPAVVKLAAAYRLNSVDTLLNPAYMKEKGQRHGDAGHP